ncbi:hypothetical protein GBAR_LOCUS30866, partial [Geodia barretti]
VVEERGRIQRPPTSPCCFEVLSVSCTIHRKGLTDGVRCLLMRCQTLTGDLPSVRGRCTVEWPFQI